MPRPSVCAAIAAVLAFLAGSGAAAADPSVFLDASGRAVVLRGPIEPGAAEAFDKVLADNPGVSVAMLDSPGGSLAEGLAMADRVFERKLATYVPAGSECASACSFVFLAGADRFAEGRLGVHQFYSSQDAGGLAEAEVQLVASEIIARLNRYGTRPEILTLVFGTAPDDMHFFTPEEISAFGIDRGDFARNVPGERSGGEGLLAVYPGLAVQGAATAAAPAADLRACAETCGREASCAAFAFFPPDDPPWPNCRLLSSVGFLDVDSRATAGLAVPAGRRPAPSAELSGIDPSREVWRDVLPIGTLHAEPHRTETAEECRSACVGDGVCAAFAYETVGGRCSLLASVSSKRPMRGVVSGVRSAHRLPIGGVVPFRR